MSESLHRTPSAGESAATLCDAAAAELGSHAAELTDDRCGSGNGWLGDCEEGRGWHRLLLAGSAAMRTLLEHHAENLSAFADRFRAADQVFGDAEADGADRYGRL